MAHERTPLSIVIVIALLLATPTGGAAWTALGTREPDTSYDALSGRMWLDPDRTALGRSVYFDAFQTTAFSTVSPNAAALDTRVFSEPLSQFHAILGVWKDCNHDAYVGDANTGLLEYRSELLLGQGPCFPQAGRGPYDVTFNDGKWVSELVSIGAADPCSFRDAGFRSAHCGGVAPFAKNPVVINSNDTMVWLDLGPPGAAAPPACTLAPPPRAVTSSVGGMLAYATCFDDERELVLFDQLDRGVDPTNSAGLYFEDPHRPQDSHSLLAPHFPVNLFGDSKSGKAGILQRGASGAAAYSIFDCQRGTGYTPVSGTTIDPTNNRTLDPQLQDPTGSWWDATEAAFEQTLGDCDPTTDNALGSIVYAGVIARASSPDERAGAARTRADDALVFSAGARSLHTDLSTGLPTDDTADGVTSNANDTVDGVYGARGPRDAGVPLMRAQFGGPMWSSRLVWQRAQTTQPIFVTAYARLNWSDVAAYNLRMPAGARGVFGAEACGGSAGVPTAADRNGWACDPGKWYKADDGSDTMPYTAGGADDGKPLAPRAGTLYDMLDVDCYDGHVASAAGVDVQVSLDQVTGALPCAPLGQKNG